MISRRRPLRLPSISLVVLGLLAVACGACGGGGGAVVKPKDFKSADALGGPVPVCKDKPSFARPLTVDLDADTRSDLEATMKAGTGVVVVAYDCVNLRVLSNCTGPIGDYDYARVDRKEEFVQIKAVDDLKLSLPLGAAKLSGEITAGRSIDLALVSIGRQTTTTFAIPKSGLVGRCEGATHFVQKAFLGAFSVATGSRGKVVAVAEMFMKSAAGSSSMERAGGQLNGSLEACRKAENEAAAPTAECKTALRVELTPIDDDQHANKSMEAGASGSKEAKRTLEVASNPCRGGSKMLDGICVTAATAAASSKTGVLCEPKDEVECKAECAKGNAGSCASAGAIALKRLGEVSWDQASGEAKPFFKKACDAGDQVGCTGILKATLFDEKMPAAEFNALVALGKKACDAGVASACEELGTLTNPEVVSGPRADGEASAKYYERGCKLGNAFACGAAGKVLLATDVNKGIAMYRRGCDGGDADVCNALAKGFIAGKRNIPKDANKGAVLAHRACELNIDNCATSADLLSEAGKPDEAKSVAQRGCEEKDVRTHLDKDEIENAKERRGQSCTILEALKAPSKPSAPKGKPKPKPRGGK